MLKLDVMLLNELDNWKFEKYLNKIGMFVKGYVCVWFNLI